LRSASASIRSRSRAVRWTLAISRASDGDSATKTGGSIPSTAEIASSRGIVEVVPLRQREIRDGSTASTPSRFATNSAMSSIRIPWSFLLAAAPVVHHPGAAMPPSRFRSFAISIA